MPVVRNRERNRSVSSSPKLCPAPRSCVSPRVASTSTWSSINTGHRSAQQQNSDVVHNDQQPAKGPCSSSRPAVADSHSQPLHASTDRHPARNANNSAANIAAVENENAAPANMSASRNFTMNADAPSGMLLRNHARNSPYVTGTRHQRRDATGPPVNNATRDSDSTIENNQQMFSTSSFPGGSGGNHGDNQNRRPNDNATNNQAANNQSASSRPRSRPPSIRLISDVEVDEILVEKGPSRKRRRLIGVIDPNASGESQEYFDFISTNFDAVPTSNATNLPPPVAAAIVNPAANRAPSRMSTTSSMSDGTMPRSSTRPRRLSSRKQGQTLEARSSVLLNNSNIMTAQAAAPTQPAVGPTSHSVMNAFMNPGSFDASTFCQTGAAMSQNRHVQQMNPAMGQMHPHMCCNMCPMQRCHPPCVAHQMNRPFPGAGYAPGLHAHAQQQQQQQPQSRHGQQHGVHVQMQQQQRLNQGFVPQELISGSFGPTYSPAFSVMMPRAPHQQPSVQQQQQQRPVVHQMLSNATRQQYAAANAHAHAQSQESMMFRAGDLAMQHGWVPGRRMPENVTPAAAMPQQMNMNVSGHMNPGVALHMNHNLFGLDYNLLSHMGVINPRRMPNGHQFFSGLDPHHHHPHDVENFDFFVNVERMGETKQKGLSKSEIEKISCYKFKGNLKPDDGQVSCVVCLSDFELKQTLRVLPCSHEFHAKCIDKWLKSNRTCPICRCDASYFGNKKPKAKVN